MQNEKLLVWMYEKIFPTRMNEIENYLQPKASTPSEHRSKAKSMQINIDGLVLEDEVKGNSMRDREMIEAEMLLPKVGSRLKK